MKSHLLINYLCASHVMYIIRFLANKICRYDILNYVQIYAALSTFLRFLLGFRFNLPAEKVTECL